MGQSKSIPVTCIDKNGVAFTRECDACRWELYAENGWDHCCPKPPHTCIYIEFSEDEPEGGS